MEAENYYYVKSYELNNYGHPYIHNYYSESNLKLYFLNLIMVLMMRLGFYSLLLDLEGMPIPTFIRK